LKDGQVFVRHGGGYEFLTIIVKRVVYKELRKILKRMDERKQNFNQAATDLVEEAKTRIHSNTFGQK